MLLRCARGGVAQQKASDPAKHMTSVLHVIDTGGPGGAETVFLQTATRLDPARFHSIAVVGGSGWLAQQFRERGVSPLIVPAKGSINGRYLSQLLWLARRQRSDVIVAHLYGSAVYASLAGMLLSVPVVSVLHGHTDVEGAGRLSSVKAALVRRGSRKVVFVSQRLQEHLEPRLRLAESQGIVIPNGVDTERFRPGRDRALRAELGLAEETALVGAIGNVRAPKAYEVLLRAARIAIDRSRQWHFVIAGECANDLGRQLGQLSRALGIERHVTFLGLRPDVARILNNLDVFVLSSHTEGFSIACIEAMACGVPVVATRSGGPEQILEGEAGILVPTGDPDALASAIERVISSKDLAATLTARAMQRVQDRYSLAAMISGYEELLERVARDSRKGRAIAGMPRRA